MINIFSFFSGAGFQDLGFELQGNYDILFVNEYHKSFNRIQVSQVKELAKLEYLISDERDTSIPARPFAQQQPGVVSVQ